MILARRAAAAVILLLALEACSGATREAPDAGEPPSGPAARSEEETASTAPDTVAPRADALGSRALGPTLILGTHTYDPDLGMTDFVAVPGGGTMPVILGEQGSFMVILAGRVEHLEGPVLVDAELRYEGKHVTSVEGDERELEPLEGEAAWFGEVYLIFETFPFTGLPLALSAEVTDAAGTSIEAQQTVLLTAAGRESGR